MPSQANKTQMCRRFEIKVHNCISNWHEVCHTRHCPIFISLAGSSNIVAIENPSQNLNDEDFNVSRKKINFRVVLDHWRTTSNSDHHLLSHFRRLRIA
jgi:hypothetical protein